MSTHGQDQSIIQVHHITHNKRGLNDVEADVCTTSVSKCIGLNFYSHYVQNEESCKPQKGRLIDFVIPVTIFLELPTI